MTSARSRLTSYYSAELDALREGARVFGEEHPSIASELELSDGVARDPHVEQLLQSFAWMMGRLRMTVEAESRKTPSLLLDEIAPHLTDPTPCMAIAECEVDSGSVDISGGVTIPAFQTLAPVHLRSAIRNDQSIRSCRFQTPFDVHLRPLQVVDVRINRQAETRLLTKRFSDYKAAINIGIQTLAAIGTAKGSTLDQPLRFFINLEDPDASLLYDILAAGVVGVAIGSESGEVIECSEGRGFRVCGFDGERLVSRSETTDLSDSILKDFFAFKSNFLFFEIGGKDSGLSIDELVEADNHFVVSLILNRSIPKRVNLTNQSFKLNCFPIVNLFEKTSEPVLASQKNYRYRLSADRQRAEDFEIHRVRDVFSTDLAGGQEKLSPYFLTKRSEDSMSNIRWMSEREERLTDGVVSSETYLSVYTEEAGESSFSDKTLFASTLCSNKSHPEKLNVGQEFAFIGTAPITSCSLLTRTTRYKPAVMQEEKQRRLLQYLSRFHVSLSDPASAKETIVNNLFLLAHPDDDAASQMIDAIESINVSESFSPVKSAGWRGYAQGYSYKLTLNERLFDGSAMLFGRVILHYLTCFSHINSFISLDLYLGNRRIYQWLPKVGRKALI